MRFHPFAPAILLLACTAAPPPAPVAEPATPPPHPAVYGLTLAEEGRVLALEDRREYDPQLAAAWIGHENPLHRARMALALGRIGPHTFVDANANGQKDAGDHQAGVDLLARLISDPDRTVRSTAAFALGEIGDTAAIEPLFQFAADPDAGVAAEATEALSKMAAAVPLGRYRELIAAARPEGVRITAMRYLFRFNSDEASAVAADSLGIERAPLREAAAYALSRRAFAPARPRLELLLTDAEMQTRAYAAAALGRIASSESVAPLLASLQDPYPWVRTNALVSLARIAAKAPSALDRPQLAQDVERVIALTDDPDPGTRASSFDILGWYAMKSGAARKRLEDIRTSGSRWDRELTAGVWAKHFTGGEPPQTNWEKVRVIEARFDASYAHDPDPMVRSAVLGNVPDDQLEANAALITAALDDPDLIVRASAIEKYGKLKERDRARLFAAEQRGRTDAMNDARLAAIAAIAEIDSAERERFLRSLIGDRDPVVRRVAADLIEQKLKLPRPQYTPLPIPGTADDYERIAKWARKPHTASIRMARGTIRVALLTDDAPITTWNFASLARRHYFDGTTFMRVVPNFVIQGGDPRNDMNGGPGYAIRDEINMEKYTRGAVGMALSGPDTGGSQFFITHSPQPHLDGGYTVFGRVTEGMTGIVDQTERGDKVESIRVK